MWLSNATKGRLAATELDRPCAARAVRSGSADFVQCGGVAPEHLRPYLFRKVLKTCLTVTETIRPTRLSHGQRGRPQDVSRARILAGSAQIGLIIPTHYIALPPKRLGRFQLVGYLLADAELVEFIVGRLQRKRNPSERGAG